MAVRYITVTPVTNLFKPATRSFGDIAIVGAVDPDAMGPIKIPVPITNPDNVQYSSATTLMGQIDASVGKITVASISNLPSAPPSATAFTPFELLIDSEVVKVTAMDETGLTVTRAPGAQAVPHAAGASVVYAAKDKAVDDSIWFKGDLGRSVRKAFAQTPGTTVVWAVRKNLAGANVVADSLKEVAKLDVQLVTLANTPLSQTVGTADIAALKDHVVTVSNTGGDGKERIGVVMLVKDPILDGTLLTAISNVSNERMVMVAHKSTEDAAAAVAGTIAGYEPHISLLLKPVSISMEGLFSDQEIEAFNNARVNWLTDPTLIPGRGFYMGEGYTLDAKRPYIDIVRTIDDISFRLKAQLISSIGDLRVSRSGLRTLVSQMTAVLEPLKQREVIESYDVFLSLLVLLDKEPASLTDAELQQIHNAQNARTVDAIISVEYAGAIHRLNITLKFE
jgi:hypothetical protein